MQVINKNAHEVQIRDQSRQMKINLRTKSSTSILYFGISKRYQTITDVFRIPEEFSSDNFLYFLRGCPKDLLQLVNSYSYFEISLKLESINPLNLTILYEDSLELLENMISEVNQVKVFFCDCMMDELDKVISLINKPNNIHFICFYNKPDDFKPSKEISDNALIFSPSDLIRKINNRKNDIISVYPELKGETFIPSSNQTSLNPSYTFVPSQINTAILNQIIANYWTLDNEEEQGDDLDIQVADSTKARENKDSFYRQNLLLSQIKKIDDVTRISYVEKLVKPVHGIEPLLSPLILVYPFHNPKVKDVYKSLSVTRTLPDAKEIKKIFRLLQKEQTKNYTYELRPDEVGIKYGAELFIITQKLLSQKLQFLDDLGFLHSSFFTSPYLRLPILGGSINRELSHFRPESFSALSRRNNRKKIKKTIDNLAKKISEDRISSKVLD